MSYAIGLTRARGLRCLLLATLCIAAGCDRQQLPESYGTYIRDGGKLVRLDLNTPEADRRDFSENCTMLVFDRWLSQPFVRSEQIAKIARRRYIRYHVERLQNDEDAREGDDVVITRANEFGAFGGPIECDFVPVKGQTEMIEVKPRKPLEKGLYYFEVADKRIPFGVKIGAVSEAESPLSAALDKYSESSNSAPKFSWAGWPDSNRRADDEPFRLPSRLFDSAEDSSYKPASVLDSSIQEWKASVEKLIAQKDFTRCAKVVRRLRTIEPRENRFVEVVKEGLRRAAADVLEKNPQVALAYANRLLMITPGDGKASQLAQSASAKMQAWNEQQAKLKDEWQRTSRDVGQTIYTCNFITKQQAFLTKEEQRGTATVNASFLINEWVSGRDRQHRNEIWFGDIQKVTPSSERATVDMMPTKHKQYYYVDIKSAQDTARLTFADEAERDTLLRNLEGARAAFERRTSPATRATAGNVRVAVESDEPVYYVQMHPHYWSPLVEFPEALAEVEWSERPGGSSYEMRADDGVERIYKEQFVPAPGSKLSFRGWPSRDRPLKINIKLR